MLGDVAGEGAGQRWASDQP